MSRPGRSIVLVALVLVIAGVAGLGAFLSHGISARGEPWAVEGFVARRLRHLAIPRQAGERVNPVTATPDVLAQGRAHFADHCASCHGNDGSGRTALGGGLYPKAPDMRLDETQRLADGEIFYIIENGVRFTGMPAWGSGSPGDERDTWALVVFIRHLPQITPPELEEMKDLNPKSAKEWAEEEEVRRFLSGGEDSPRSGH
ncbi:MAG TPA: c-type cytochrome [Vicinamibacteria bacterium]|jgi:mono/diheme cytochrome c family protein|nr:c-type cytochrome [Vicinamibacteria bacterium]